MTELVSTYGLSALFLGVVLESAGIPVPGETALIVASVLATRGTFALSSVIAVAAGAAVVGDNIGYWIGLRGGRRLLERWRPLARYADRVLPPAERFFGAHGGKSVFLARFVPVLRVTGAFTAGVARMDWWRFFLWNMAGGVAWAATVALVAYHLGAAAAATMGRLGLVGTAIVMAGAATVFVVMHRARCGRLGERAGPRIRSRRGNAPAAPRPEVREALTSRTVTAVDLGARRSTYRWRRNDRRKGETSASDNPKDHPIPMVR
jgi:membrane protein DedA with SNARE-associated domain